MIKQLIRFSGVLVIFIYINSCNFKDKVYKVPFEIVKNQIIIKIFANTSDTLNFIFDTGNENAHIDSAVASSLKLQIIDFKMMQCAGSTEYIPLVKCDYKIGGYKLDTIETTTGSLADYSRILKRRIDGIIGQDILNNFVVYIDFTARMIELYPPDYAYVGKGEQITIIGRGPTIMAEVSDNEGKKITGEFILDTGSNSSITLSSKLTDTTKIKEMIGEYKTYNSYDMCGNAHPEYEGRGKDVVLGKTHTGKYPLTLSQTTSGVLADENYIGLIGIPVIKCFNILIDLQNSKLFIEPNENLKDYSKTAKH